MSVEGRKKRITVGEWKKGLGKTLPGDIERLVAAVDKLALEIEEDRSVSNEMFQTLRADINGLSTKLNDKASKADVNTLASKTDIADLKVDNDTMNKKLDILILNSTTPSPS